MATRETYFDLPNSPEEFGVALPPPELRRIDWTALEWFPMLRSFIEYIKTYHADKFNDFVAQNAVMMLAELLAYGASNAALHADVLANEAFFPLAVTRDAVAQHLKLIDRPLKRQTSAIVDVACRLRGVTSSIVKIQPGIRFSLAGSDGGNVFYELFRAPGDYTNTIDVQPGKAGVVAFGIEGKFEDPIVVVSDGAQNQRIIIDNPEVLDDPIWVDVASGATTTRWSRVSAIERAGANDEVYEVRFYESYAEIVFGDGVTGAMPVSGQQITVTYRTGGGIRGRIPASAIDISRSVPIEAPYNGVIEVSFKNLEGSIGGSDQEDIETAKRVAPREAVAKKAAVTGEDYSILAKNFRHPVFGSVMKAVAGVKTEINANIVELYVLAEGTDGNPAIPSEGLKQGLLSFFSPIQVLTDEVRVLEAEMVPVDVEIQVVIARNADQTIVIENVNAAIDEFFDTKNRELGEGIYKAQLYEKIQKIDGVRFATIHSPTDNIYPIGSAPSNSENPNVVRFNQLLVLGDKKIDFFAERDIR